ncbi:heavy metal translocating P-type ATPase [Taklimakanibacter deserti]|uniref:heavy metal translocating P-type ATPase n=1 Tax=Taklimakanibacter deserti TaxID=2267839 RepID=UPI000E64758B
MTAQTSIAPGGTAKSAANTNINRPHDLTAVLLIIATAGLCLGLWSQQIDNHAASGVIWSVATLPVLLSLFVQIVQSLRRGDVGLDIVAALSMSAALLFGENLAANVVAIMYAGGQFLESFADRRAGREMTALLARVPRTAIRQSSHGLEEVSLERLIPGDHVVVRSGEVVPVDGHVQSDAVLDYASLTGEALPVKCADGALVLSGAGNVGQTFMMTALRTADESTYSGIVRLVERARLSKAPMTRLADRYAIVFLACTVALAGAAWAFTSDPIRGLSVLVVATPCPLILAVPVAIVAGLSRAARAGVLVKGGAILEMMATIRTIVLDKTGTLTGGTPKLVLVNVASPSLSEDEALRLAASLDQASTHPIAKALVGEAKHRHLDLASPTHVVETPGEGLRGKVEGKTIAIGGIDYVAKHARKNRKLLASVSASAGTVLAALAVSGKVVALFGLADKPREGIPALLDSLREAGIRRIILASGDRQAVAEEIARDLPFDLVRGDLDPNAKVAIVHAEGKQTPVMMVGDGINDAPALAAANVGVAMGATGAAASSETADVVIVQDRLDALLPAIRIARRSRNIALESVTIGLGLSGIGMLVAAFGYLTPVRGAIVQEVIDVLVILNALRVLR